MSSELPVCITSCEPQSCPFVDDSDRTEGPPDLALSTSQTTLHAMMSTSKSPAATPHAIARRCRMRQGPIPTNPSNAGCKAQYGRTAGRRQRRTGTVTWPASAGGTGRGCLRQRGRQDRCRIGAAGEGRDPQAMQQVCRPAGPGGRQLPPRRRGRGPLIRLCVENDAGDRRHGHVRGWC